MGRNVVTYIIIIIVLVLVQVLICNRIMLFGFAVPVIFFYPILHLSMGTSVKGVLTLAFLLGLAVDIFSDTPGVNALSCTVLAVLRRPIYHSFTGNDEALATLSPSMSSLGFWTFFKYLLVCTVTYMALAIGVEYFTLTDVWRTLGIICSSTLLSFVLLMGVDSLIGSRS